MVDKFDPDTSNDSEPVKKILSVLKRKVLTDLYRAFLEIEPQRRVDLKRIRKSVDGESDTVSDVIEVKTTTDADQAKDKKKKINFTMSKLLSNEDITKSEYEYLKENLDFDFDIEYKDFADTEKIWLKYMKTGVSK